MAQFKLLAFNNPVEGREAEYNAWYSDTHLAIFEPITDLRHRVA